MKYHYTLFVTFEKGGKILNCLLQIIGGALWVSHFSPDFFQISYIDYFHQTHPS